MVADLQRRERSRELRVVAGPRWNPEMARWEARVVRNKPPAPAWRRPLLIGLSVAAPLLAFMEGAIWVLFSLSATAVVALCGFALLALFGVVKHHARTITMEQKVTIRGACSRKTRCPPRRPRATPTALDAPLMDRC